MKHQKIRLLPYVGLALTTTFSIGSTGTPTPHELVLAYETNHQYASAIELQQTIVDKDPSNPDERFKLACLLTMYGNGEKALPLYEKINRDYPTFVPALYNHAYTLKNLDRPNQALTWYEKVLALEPDHHFAHLGLAQCHLILGEYEKGWPDFQWRDPSIPHSLAQFDITRYPVQGKRILIRGEWGFGDNFQFIRYASLLKERGAYIIVQVYDQLRPLFSLCPYIDEVVDNNQGSFPAFDIQIPLLTLPCACKTTLETIPNSMPYLYARSDLATYWHEYLAQHHCFTIGINWHGCGDTGAPAQLNKNIPLATMLKALSAMPGVIIYSLQKNVGLDEIKTLGDLGPNLHTFAHLDEEHGPFMDTAAIIANLDLVITVDTSIAHLAGALGTKTWVILPHKADWRWLLNRSDSPWYPTMTLFRQKEPGDWESVMNTVRESLTALLTTTN